MRVEAEGVGVEGDGVTVEGVRVEGEGGEGVRVEGGSQKSLTFSQAGWEDYSRGNPLEH